LVIFSKVQAVAAIEDFTILVRRGAVLPFSKRIEKLKQKRCF
jgi:hypothetical protein